MKQANFIYEKHPTEDGVVIIRDVGPWDLHSTITNDAEGVVKRILSQWGSAVRRILYYDSKGQVDELCFEDREFTRFSIGTKGYL